MFVGDMSRAPCHPSRVFNKFERIQICEYAATATIHEAMMKNGQCFLLISGERIGTTTAPNRSTVIRIRL